MFTQQRKKEASACQDLKSSAGFTLESLQRVNETLLAHGTVDDANQETLVESFHLLAQLLTWGDQHGPQLFDFFVEQRMLAHFVRVLVQCAPPQHQEEDVQPLKPRSPVAVQLLQTLCILVFNTSRQTSVYYLFSNNYLNDLILLAKSLDLEADEEVLAWYISFLKAISLRLNVDTIQFFVAAAKYVRHGEGMVRASARSATLNVLKVEDAAARAFVLSPDQRGFFSGVAAAAAALAAALAQRMGNPSQRWGDVAQLVPELDDLLCYANDLLEIRVPGIEHLLEQALWAQLAAPMLAALDGDDGDAAADAAADGDGDAVCVPRCAALYVLSRLCRVLSHAPLLVRLAEGALAGRSARREQVLRAVAQPERDFGAAVAALYLLASLASNGEVPTHALRAVGLLPVARRDGAPAEGDGAEEESGDEARGPVQAALLSLLRFCARLSDARSSSSAHLQAVAAAGWLLRALCTRREWRSEAHEACRAALLASTEAALRMHAGGAWADALLPLLQDGERLGARAREQPSLTEEAVAGLVWRCAAAARAATEEEGEAIEGRTGASSLEAERALAATRAWLVFRAALAPPGAGDAFVALPPLPALPASPGAEVVADAAAADAAPLPQEFCDGFTLPALAEEAPSCRAAFERGRERRLALSCVTCALPGARGDAGRTAMLLLTENLPSGLGSTALVRSVAPVLGAEAHIDASHPKWLHLRVRPSVAALRLSAPADTPCGPDTPPFPPGWAEPARMHHSKRLQDGTWTLAFDSEAACAEAREMVEGRAAQVRADARARLGALMAACSAQRTAAGAEEPAQSTEQAADE